MESSLTTAAIEGPHDDATCRALLLGVRPEDERTMREPFALLRGIAIHEIVRHRHAAAGCCERRDARETRVAHKLQLRAAEGASVP